MKAKTFCFWRFLGSISFVAAFVFVLFATLSRSDWNKERLYRQLLQGEVSQQVSAASTLVELQGEAQLLRALRSAHPGSRELAQNALWQLWSIDAGAKPSKRLKDAALAMEQKQTQKALFILNQLLDEQPLFAEAWNRRGLLHMQRKHYQEAVDDFGRALQCNPQHFGAWQGMGLCHVYLGSFPKAARCLKASLSIHPFDSNTRTLLQQCLQLMDDNSTVVRPRRQYI